mmetsp:Transcript_28292/g.28658  ORF Transcript_28292/g.28658 Transcript_28292/m.28658 type:complete len:230 (+) Transcript_28292:308-997(+)
MCLLLQSCQRLLESDTKGNGTLDILHPRLFPQRRQLNLVLFHRRIFQRFNSLHPIIRTASIPFHDRQHPLQLLGRDIVRFLHIVQKPVILNEPIVPSDTPTVTNVDLLANLDIPTGDDFEEASWFRTTGQHVRRFAIMVAHVQQRDHQSIPDGRTPFRDGALDGEDTGGDEPDGPCQDTLGGGCAIRERKEFAIAQPAQEGFHVTFEPCGGVGSSFQRFLLDHGMLQRF